jgi:two-component system, sensor histidine kinase
MSLFARLIILVVIAMAPVVGLEIYREIELRDARKDEVIQETKNLLHRVKEQQNHIIDGIRQVIATLAQTNSVRQQYAPVCQGLMDRLRLEYPDYLEIWITDYSGAVTCATEKRAIGTSIADHRHFQQARAGTSFAVGSSILEGPGGKATLPMAIPYRDTNGVGAGAIVALLDLDWLSTYLADRSMPDSANLTVTDENGTILLRVPDTPGAVGSPLPERFRYLLAADREGVVEMEGLDERRKIFAYSPSSPGFQDMFVAVGVDAQLVRARMDGALIQSWFLAALATAMLAAVWFGGRLFVVNPVNALLDATKRWQKGDRTARVRLPDHASEIGMLGQAFDEMADGLEAEIGRREKAHAAVLAAEARLRAMFETAVDAMVVVDADGVVQSFNPAAERIFGYCATEVIGRGVSMLVPSPGWCELVAGAEREVEGRRRGGLPFPLELSIGTWFMEEREYSTGIMRDISPRRRVEREREALRAALDSERTLLQAVVRHMSTGLMVIEAPSGRLVLHNEEAERLLRQPLHLNALHELDRQGARRPDGTPLPWMDHPAARALTTGEIVRQEEISCLRGDGSTTVLSVNATPVHDETGAITLAVCTFHDISSRKTMEQALRRSEERLSIALSSAQAGTWDWDIATGRATWSEQTYRLLGVRTSRPVSQENWFEAIHPDDRSRVREGMEAGLAERQANYHSEFRIIHPRKGECWIEAIGRATYAADGTPLRLSGLHIDITERKRMEEALRRSKEHLTIALEAAQAGTWEWDVVANEAVWSDALFRMHNLDPDKDRATYETWIETLHPDDRESTLQAFKEALNGGQVTYRAEYRIIHPEKGIRWLEALGRASYTDDGRPVKLSGISLDITERKQMEGELQWAKAMAEEASLAKTKFLAAASHDLRQPIQSMLLFTSSLGTHIRDEAGAEKLRNLERSMDALKELLDSLLDVSRLDAGQIAPQIQDFPLESLLEEIRTAYSAVAESKHLEWRVETSGTVIRSDRNLLGRMVRNLVENALRYTPEGFVRIECHEIPGHVRIEIRDSGIGIPADQAEHVWQEFHQVGNPERDREQGLGLGLAIVRRLAKLLGHRAGMSSVQGSGSVFSIEVPHGEAAAEEDAGTDKEHRVSDGRGCLALVVDDDAMVLAALEATLLDWGYQVIAVGALDEAIAEVSSGARPPDVVIADYRLRDGMVGTEVILRIRELTGSHVPAILLTGEAGRECSRDADRFGFDLVHKPVTPHQLGSILHRQLERVSGSIGKTKPALD